MPQPTVANVITRFQNLMGDPEANLWVVGYAPTLEFINDGQELLNAIFAEMEIETFELFATITGITAGSTSVGRGTTPALPVGFQVPIDLWERATGGLSTDWVKMTNRDIMTPGQAQTQAFVWWAWHGDAIQLPPSTGSRDLQVQYIGVPAPFTGGTDALPIPNSTAALAYLAASVACRTADQHGMADRFEARGTMMGRSLARVQAREQHAIPIVRRAFRPGAYALPFRIRTN